MASQTNAPNLVLDAASALAVYRLVTASGAYAGLDTARDWVGVSQQAVGAAGTANLPVRLPCAGSCKVVASEAIAKGDKLYKAASGKVSKTETGSVQVGVALEAASGDNSIFEAMLAAAGANDVAQRIIDTKTLAATGNQALAVADLGKLVLAPNTGAVTLALPAAASCTNRGFIIKKTSADAQAVTIDPDASETIDGGANFASIDAANDFVEIVSNGTAWYIIAKGIA
jgi:hypothetical protein